MDFGPRNGCFGSRIGCFGLYTSISDIPKRPFRSPLRIPKNSGNETENESGCLWQAKMKEIVAQLKNPKNKSGVATTCSNSVTASLLQLKYILPEVFPKKSWTSKKILLARFFEIPLVFRGVRKCFDTFVSVWTCSDLSSYIQMHWKQLVAFEKLLFFGSVLL